MNTLTDGTTRMTTISGMRRRVYSRKHPRFLYKNRRVQRENLVDMSLLEHCVREHLNKIAIRRMAVLDPVKLVITNYPEGQKKEVLSENNRAENNGGTRPVLFSRELWIEREISWKHRQKMDRLGSGRYCTAQKRLHCKMRHFVKDDFGNITEIHCSYIPEAKRQRCFRRPCKSTIHWEAWRMPKKQR